jgi:adenylyltransferase/sulfurtransferase
MTLKQERGCKASQKKEESDKEKRIRELELEVERLKVENTRLRQWRTESSEEETLAVPSSPLQEVTELTPEHIERYSRQLLLQDGFGVQGQCRLLSSSVLVVGAGGIGSTVLLYLAATGIGRISVVDFDGIDKSNLHRQVIHKERDVGLNKAISACRSMKELNPSIQCVPILETLTHENALDLVSYHDVIVDASDNPRTRYLINDACVLANKPLVSGSAIGTEGQLTVYNHLDGSCYRCLYPRPNAAEGCKSCSDSGVSGPVPGLIGLLQSLEVVKILTGIG